MVLTFAEATVLKQSSPNTYEATLDNDWCIGSVPHGGYVTALFLKVAETHFLTTLSSQSQPHCIALHLDFLRRTSAGPATFTLHPLKLGRQASVLHITLSQSSREEVTGTLTHSNMHTETGVSFTTSFALLPPPPPVNLALLSAGRDEHWVAQPSMPFSHFRKATQRADFFFPRLGQRQNGVAEEWIRFRNGERWTNISLGYVADMWPMPVEAFVAGTSSPYDVSGEGKKVAPTVKFWYPTVLLNLDVKKVLPEEGVEWLYVRASMKQIRNGRMDLDIVILDEGGEIVALSHHVALAVDSSRNVAARSTVKI